MSIHGIVLLDVVGLILIVTVVNLVRTRQLTVAYGVVWLTALVVMTIVVSCPPLLALVTRAVGAIYPASALTLLALVLAFGMLIFFSVQLSAISARQVELVQALALSELRSKEVHARDLELGEWSQ